MDLRSSGVAESIVVGAVDMFGIYRYASRHRRSPLIQFVARKSREFVEHFENKNNYDSRINGEKYVLEALSGQDFRYVFDVGANIGEWALMAREAFPRAEIHCFEIVDTTADLLEERIGYLEQIVINRFGLSDKAGEISIKCFPGYDKLSSIIDVQHGFESTSATGRVMSGDEYVEASGIERIDFVKIDVEAAEHLVLLGMQRSLDAGKVDVIQFEYGTGSIITKYLLYDYYKFLAPRGYALGKIYPNYVAFRPYDFGHEDFYGPNFLAVREERKDLIARLSR